MGVFRCLEVCVYSLSCYMKTFYSMTVLLALLFDDVVHHFILTSAHLWPKYCKSYTHKWFCEWCNSNSTLINMVIGYIWMYTIINYLRKKSFFARFLAHNTVKDKNHCEQNVNVDTLCRLAYTKTVEEEMLVRTIYECQRMLMCWKTWYKREV